MAVLTEEDLSLLLYCVVRALHERPCPVGQISVCLCAQVVCGDAIWCAAPDTEGDELGSQRENGAATTTVRPDQPGT